MKKAFDLDLSDFLSSFTIMVISCFASFLPAPSFLKMMLLFYCHLLKREKASERISNAALKRDTQVTVLTLFQILVHIVHCVTSFLHKLHQKIKQWKLFTKQFAFKFLLKTNYYLNYSFLDSCPPSGFFLSWIAISLILSTLYNVILKTFCGIKNSVNVFFLSFHFYVLRAQKAGWKTND